MDIQLNLSRVAYKKKLEKQIMDWGVKALKVYEIWKESRGEGVNVAVLDTGIAKHPDLDMNIKGGINFSSTNEKDYADRAGHGTHVAGIIGGIDNEEGIIGVAPKVNMYAVKVLGDNGGGSFQSVTEGIEWAIENNMDIITMSLGSNSPSNIVHEAIKKAYKNNITVVAAAGNDGDTNLDNDIDYPAKYPEAIAVGAINKYYKRSWFSSDGKELEIMAPGEDIYSTYLEKNYAILSGTSMATPFITGVLALLISKHKNKKDNKTSIDTPERIREHLLRTADDKGEIGKDNFYGYGLVNPLNFMKNFKNSNLYC